MNKLSINEADMKRSALALADFYTKSNRALSKDVAPIIEDGFKAIAAGDEVAFNKAFNAVTETFARATPSDVVIPGCTHHDAMQTLKALRESIGVPLGR